MDESAQGTTQSADGNQDVDILYVWKIPVDRTYVKSIIGVLKVVIAVSSCVKGFTHTHHTHPQTLSLSLSESHLSVMFKTLHRHTYETNCTCKNSQEELQAGTKLLTYAYCFQFCFVFRFFP